MKVNNITYLVLMSLVCSTLLGVDAQSQKKPITIAVEASAIDAKNGATNESAEIHKIEQIILKNSEEAINTTVVALTDKEMAELEMEKAARELNPVKIEGAYTGVITFTVPELPSNTREARNILFSNSGGDTYQSEKFWFVAGRSDDGIITTWAGTNGHGAWNVSLEPGSYDLLLTDRYGDGWGSGSYFTVQDSNDGSYLVGVSYSGSDDCGSSSYCSTYVQGTWMATEGVTYSDGSAGYDYCTAYSGDYGCYTKYDFDVADLATLSCDDATACNDGAVGQNCVFADDACESCNDQGGVDLADSDGDGVCNDADQCEGSDDTVDADADGIIDCLDSCVGSATNIQNGCDSSDASGVLYDSDIQDTSTTYDPSGLATVTITLDAASYNRIDFSGSYQTEANYDYVRICPGTDAGGTYVTSTAPEGCITYHGGPEDIQQAIEGNVAIVKWRSDGSYQSGYGFELNWAGSWVSGAGCTSATACNYDADATSDDGSCIEPDGVCDSCLDGAIVDNDSDDDGVCDSADQCDGADDTIDYDADGIIDCLDDCVSGTCSCGESSVTLSSMYGTSIWGQACNDPNGFGANFSWSQSSDPVVPNQFIVADSDCSDNTRDISDAISGTPGYAFSSTGSGAAAGVTLDAGSCVSFYFYDPYGYVNWSSYGDATVVLTVTENPDPNAIQGCMTADACNYNDQATYDDGSCVAENSCGACPTFADDGTSNGDADTSCLGCTDSMACNHDADATVDDGSCELAGDSCTCTHPGLDGEIKVSSDSLNDSWHEYTVGANVQSLTFDTCTGFVLSNESGTVIDYDDSKLFIFTDCADWDALLAGGNASYTSNDDNYDACGLYGPSSITFDNPVEGTTYYIRVSTYSGGYFGTYTLNATEVTCASQGLAQCDDGSCGGVSCAGSYLDDGSLVCDASECADVCSAGDANGDGITNVTDVVMLVSVALDTLPEGVSASDCADANGDGGVDVTDIVTTVDIILGNTRAMSADEAQIIKSGDKVSIDANGFVGAVQMTLDHGDDFSIELTDNAMVAEYATNGNSTTLIVVRPEGDLFTATGDYEVAEIIVANSEGTLDADFVVVPDAFALSSAYPNPFNPTTSVALSLPNDSYVSVTVYNLMGQTVATIADGYMGANVYDFTWNASSVPSGIYFVRAEAGTDVAIQKVMLLK